MFVPSSSQLVLHRNGDARIKHLAFQNVRDGELHYVLRIPLAARPDTILAHDPSHVDSFRVVRANALERAVGWSNVRVVLDPSSHSRGENTVSGVLLHAAPTQIAVGTDTETTQRIDGKEVVVRREDVVVMEKTDILSVSILNAPQVRRMLQLSQQNGWVVELNRANPFAFGYELSMPSPVEVLLDVVYSHQKLRVTRWAAIESPFEMDNVAVTVVESMDDRRPVERQQAERTVFMAASSRRRESSAVPYDDGAGYTPPPAPRERTGFADEYKVQGVGAIFLREGHNRVRLPDIDAHDAGLVYIAKLECEGVLESVRRQAFARLQWESADFAFSGWASVKLNDAEVRRTWFDAWKHPERQWIDLPSGNEVVVFRQVHSRRQLQAGLEVVIRIEAYNRSSAPATVKVRECFPRGLGEMEKGGELWTAEPAPMQKQRLAAERLIFEITAGGGGDDMGDTSLWTYGELVGTSNRWVPATNPETGVAVANAWEITFANVAPKSGQLYLYKTMVPQ